MDESLGKNIYDPITDNKTQPWFQLYVQIQGIITFRAVDYSIFDPFGKSSQYRKFPLHKQSENPWVCY